MKRHTMCESHFFYRVRVVALLVAVFTLFTLSAPSPAAAPWLQEAKVFADDGQKFDKFGNAVAIDGDTAVVGAPEKETEQGSDSGAAYIYVRNSSNWSQQAKLKPNDSEGGERFGERVAIKGNTVIIGAPSAWGPRGRDGAAYIFTRTGSTWAQKAKFVPPDPEKTAFGFGRAVDVDGNTAIVGDRKAVHVFVRDRATDTWSLETTVRHPEGGEFALAVAIDGNTIIAGRYVFVRDANTPTWSVQAKLSARGKSSLLTFGDAVAIDGNNAVLGAPAQSRDKGAAYLFERDPKKGSWSQVAEFTPRGVPPFHMLGFGGSVAIDDNTIILGTCLAGLNAILPVWEKRGVYVYVRDRRRNRWSEQTKIQFKDNEKDKDYVSGCSINLSGDRIIVGDDFGYGRDRGTGAAHIFTRASSASAN